MIANLATTAARASSSLEEIRSAGWDELVGEYDLYLSTPWLQVEEQITASPPTYLTLTLGDGLAAGLTCHQLGPDAPAWPFARIDAFLLRLLRESERNCAPAEAALSATLPTLLCGGRRPGHTRLLLRPELDESARRELARQVLCEAEALAHQRGVASLSFLYVDEDDQLLRDALVEREYLEFPSATAARLDVPIDFDGYLQRFERERRRTIQKERKKLTAAGIEYRALPLTGELIETILPQELALYDRYGTEFPAADAARLHRSVAALLGERVQVLTAQQDGQIRGFVVCIRWRNTLFGRQVGFDYAFQGRLPLYFGLGYYALVEYAAAQGVRHIEYGIGSERAKALRGCALRQQYGYVKALTPAGHTAVERALEELRV